LVLISQNYPLTGPAAFDPQGACPDVVGDPDPDPKKNGCPKVKLELREIKILVTGARRVGRRVVHR
jgi:hypothetical protein